MSKCLRAITFLVVFFYASLCLAYPVEEKSDTAGLLPLEVFGAQPSFLFIPATGDFADKYLFTAYGTNLIITDLETWDDYLTQPDSFSASVADVTLLANGISLIVALTDGNIARIELDDEDTFVNTITVSGDSTTASLVMPSVLRYQSSSTTEAEEEAPEPVDSRQIDLATDMTSAGINYIAADPVDDVVYMVNDAGYYFEYNLHSNRLTELELIDEAASEDDEEGATDSGTTVRYKPTDIIFADSDDGDKVLITTETGEVLVISPGSGHYGVVQLSSSVVSNAEVPLSKMTVTPDGNYVYLIDSENDAVWVFSARLESFVDQYSTGTGLDPVMMDTGDNNTFTSVFAYADAAGNVVTYVSGATGITVVNADSPGTAQSSTKVVDVDEATPDTLDPIAMSGIPGPLAATSPDTGYVFSANGDASLSVLTDNPWITISNIAPGSVTAVSSSFTVAFQTDTVGSYTVRANSNMLGTTGTELVASVSADATNTDISTAVIDINTFARSTFIEGYNKIFILLTDADSNIGHAAALLHVDRPPEAETINSAIFGNKKVYMSFDTSPDADIASYVLYAVPAESPASPVCPGGITFTTGAVVATMTAAQCSEATCEGVITGLVNDVPYCLALKIVDEAGQESPFSTYGTAITPEQTVGPAGYLGETSCALDRAGHRAGHDLFYFVCMMLVGSLLVLRLYKARVLCKRRVLFFILGTGIIFICYSQNGLALERSPQNWTFEAKVNMMFPTSSDVRDFLGTCCNLGGEIEFGWLYKNRYNVTVSIGGSHNSGTAVGIRSGRASGDEFGLILIPMRLDFVYRFDFKSEQFFLPYVRAGADVVYFRETTAGESIQNFKYGVHGGGGVGLLLDRVESLNYDIETGMGVNDIYLVFEGRYAALNSFKSGGLDLSGFYPYVGLLFEF